MRNTPSQSTLLQTALVLSLLGVAAGCGLGTEIGNGFKADGESSKSGKANKSAEPQAANDKDTPTAEGGNGKGGSSGDGDTAQMPPESGSDGGVGDSDDGAMVGEFDTTPLHAACATPFAAGYEAPFDLALVAGGTKTKVLSVTVFDVTKRSVDLKRIGKPETLRRIAPSPVTMPEPWAWSALVADGAGMAQTEAFTCKDKRVETTNLTGADGDVTKVSVTLVAQDGKETALVWFAKPKTETAKATLFRIELRAAGAPATDGPVVLEAAP